jgi:hypothetical protein
VDGVLEEVVAVDGPALLLEDGGDDAVAVDEAPGEELGAEPGREGEAEAGDLLVGEAASEAALVDLPVEHDVGQAVVVDRLGRGAAEADAQAVLVDLGEVEDDLAVPVRAGAHDVVHLNDGILGGGVAEEEGGGGPGGVLGLALEALEAEGHERAEAVEGIAIRERAPAV